MFKVKRIAAAGLAAVMAMSAFGFNVLADDDTDSDIVYSYINEDNETVNVTRAELDAGYWNTDALGSTAPFVYEDFPVKVNKFVDDYANLSLRLTYLKTLPDSGSASLAIVDMDTEETIAEYSDLSEGFYTDPLEIGKDYALVLTENINGTETEYYKAVITKNSEAEMPDYITEGTTDIDKTLLVGNIEDLKASESVNEDGEVEIDGTMKRYEKVNAAVFDDYKSSLDADNIYRIYAKDDDGTAYTGFISTYADDSDLGIYTPDAEIMTWDAYNSASASTLPSSGYVTAARIKAATKRSMDHFADYGFKLNDSLSNYMYVYSFQVPEDEDLTSVTFSIHSQNSITYEMWIAASLTSTPTRVRSAKEVSLNYSRTFIPTEYVDAGDYLYFVIYDQSMSTSNGMVGIEQHGMYPSSDVSGSRYEAYQNGGAETLAKTTYELYSDRDADSFYINYTGSTATNYKALLFNTVEETSSEQCEKTMEVSYWHSTLDYFYASDASTDDVYTAAIGVKVSAVVSSSSTYRAFLTIYGDVPDGKSSEYALRYYKKG